MGRQTKGAVSSQRMFMRRALIVAGLVIIGASIARAGVAEVEPSRFGGFCGPDASDLVLIPDNGTSFQYSVAGHMTETE